MIEKDLSVLPAQRELLEAREKIVMFVGGLGSGKSRGLAYKALLLGLENKGCVGIFVEPTYTMIRDIAVPTIKEVLEGLEVPYRYLANDHTFQIADSFTLLMRSGDRPEHLVGLNAAFGLIDEPALQSEEVPKTVLARLRDPKAKHYQLVLGGTPEGLESWFYAWSIRPDIKVIRARTYENPFLPEDYVAQLSARFTEEEVLAYIEGQFVSFSGAWFHSFPTVTEYTDFHGIKLFIPPENASKQLVLGVDTGGGTDLDACSLALIDKRDRHLVASWKDSKASIEEMAQKAKLLVDHYTTKTAPEFPGVYGTRVGTPPMAVIEKNGVGMATVQAFSAAKITYTSVSTTEASRYSGLHAVRSAVEQGLLFGPSELADEAKKLVVEKGRFKGEKDLCMACGFALNHIASHPYIAPAKQRQSEVLDLSSRLGKKRGW
jgi:hypothetical protein